MAIGLTNNVTIGRIINENRRPSQKTLQMILTKFSNVDANWLFTGIGEMYKSDFDQNAESILRESLVQINDTKYVGSKSKKMSGQMSGDTKKVSGQYVGSHQNKNNDSLKDVIKEQINILLIDGIRDLLAENAALKAENAQLQGKIEDLKK